MDWMINEFQFKFQQGQETLLLSRVFRPAHTAFYSVGTRGTFSGGVKQLDCEADHWPPTNAAVKNLWSYTCTPSYAFTATTGTTLLYLLQENAIPKTQQFTPAMEADALLLILLWCVYIQKMSVLLRVGNLKVTNMGQPLGVHVYIRPWKKANLLKGITGWGDSHLGMTTLGRHCFWKWH